MRTSLRTVKTLEVILSSTAVETKQMKRLSGNIQRALIRGLSSGDLFMLTNEKFHFEMLGSFLVSCLNRGRKTVPDCCLAFQMSRCEQFNQFEPTFSLF